MVSIAGPSILGGDVCICFDFSLQRTNSLDLAAAQSLVIQSSFPLPLLDRKPLSETRPCAFIPMTNGISTWLGGRLSFR